MTYTTTQGEKLSGDTSAAATFCKSFDSFLRENKYDLNQVYNADETGLYWKGLPRRTLICANEKGAAGGKCQKDRVTALFCANATGTHKIPLLVIGKSANPRCFKNVNLKNLPVGYKSQKSAWINRPIFKDWYENMFLPEVRQFHQSAKMPRKILLLLDNAPSHPKLEELNAIDDECQVRTLKYVS